MQYKLVKSEESQSIICIVVVVAVFFLLILPQLEKMRSHEDSDIMEKFNNKLNNFHKIDTNICSASCCGNQYPVGFDIKKDDRLADGKYIPTNMTCTGHHGTGCVCVTKEQRDYLTERGDNA
jgi:hypothetical protein